MLAYFAAHKVLPHQAFNKFRCVIAEQCIIESIRASAFYPLLSKGQLLCVLNMQLPMCGTAYELKVDTSLGR